MLFNFVEELNDVKVILLNYDHIKNLNLVYQTLFPFHPYLLQLSDFLTKIELSFLFQGKN